MSASPTTPEVVIVRTGTANLASVLGAFERLGIVARLTSEPSVVASAHAVVLPGVGAFGAAMDELRRSALVEPLRRRFAQRRPTLAICLGLQLLFDSSEESPGSQGLGVIPGVIKRFTGDRLRVPHVGWNHVKAESACELLRDGHAYYSNSYRAAAPMVEPSTWLVARSDHAGPFVAAVEQGPILACQFHPELSGTWGLELLARWLRAAELPCSPSAHALRGKDVPPVSALAHRVTRRIIPCLDVNSGRVVKGIRFQGLRDAGDPAELAARYEAQGADELVVLDVSATVEARATRRDTVRAVRRALSIPLTVGGGVRAIEDAGLLLDHGADKVGVNTAGVERPELIREIATRFGAQCAIVSIDAARAADSSDDDPRWEVVIHAGTTRTGIDAVAWARRAADLGAGEILLTSWDRDGTRSGYDLRLLRAVSSAVPIPVIASGGAAGVDHLHEALVAGADAVLAASIFHDAETTPDALKLELERRGVLVRSPVNKGAQR